VEAVYCTCMGGRGRCIVRLGVHEDQSSPEIEDEKAEICQELASLGWTMEATVDGDDDVLCRSFRNKTLSTKQHWLCLQATLVLQETLVRQCNRRTVRPQQRQRRCKTANGRGRKLNLQTPTVVQQLSAVTQAATIETKQQFRQGSRTF
jgi:hypothetical protein